MGGGCNKTQKEQGDDHLWNKWIPKSIVILIVLISLGSFIWLWKVTDLLKQDPASVQIEYKLVVDENYFKARNIMPIAVISDAGIKEDACFKFYREAEEHLRTEMGTWLTILGFFGVVLGLLIPLASYMLQHHSLAEERTRVMEECRQTIDQFKDSIKSAAQGGELGINTASTPNDSVPQGSVSAEAIPIVSAENIEAAPPTEPQKESK